MNLFLSVLQDLAGDMLQDEFAERVVGPMVTGAANAVTVPAREPELPARALGAIRDANERMDRMALACQAMWELLAAHTSLTEDDLIAKIQEVDLRDGQIDGKMVAKQVHTCPDCNRAMSARHRRCLFCGRKLPPGSPFL